MGLEVGTFVSDLVVTNPSGPADPKSEGDNHIRLIKNTLKNTFPNASRAFRFPVSPPAKTANYQVVATDEHALIKVDASSGPITVTLPALINIFPGWAVTILKSDSSANAVTVAASGVEKINGQSTRIISRQYQAETYVNDNVEFKVANLVPPDVNTFPAGTSILFAQASAPLGWTKVVAATDELIVLKQDGGGGTGGTLSPLAASVESVNANGDHNHGGNVGGTAISIAQMASHTHNIVARVVAGAATGLVATSNGSTVNNQVSDNSGNNNTHNHSISSSGTHAHSFGLLNFKRRQVILCTKD